MVEDNVINQKIEILFLKDMGIFDIDLVHDGDEAMSLCSINSYSLILLDIGLPGLNGFKVSQLIRNNTKNKSVPIIAITAFTKEDIEVKCYISGINYVITKPILINELKTAINQLIGICKIIVF